MYWDWDLWDGRDGREGGTKVDIEAYMQNWKKSPTNSKSDLWWVEQLCQCQVESFQTDIQMFKLAWQVFAGVWSRLEWMMMWRELSLPVTIKHYHVIKNCYRPLACLGEISNEPSSSNYCLCQWGDPVVVREVLKIILEIFAELSLCFVTLSCFSTCNETKL